MAIICECGKLPRSVNLGCYPKRKTLVYHPSNSKLGIAIKGTNLRVSFKYI